MADVIVLESVFNDEAFVERAIASVLRQSLRSFEFVLLDDGDERPDDWP